MRKNLVKVRDALSSDPLPSLPAAAPRLEHEPLHKKLQRLNAEQVRLIAEIQDHKVKWADRNRVAQEAHLPPSTPEITAFKTHHRELSSRLAEVNLQIGVANKELRATKAARQAGQGPLFDRMDPGQQRRARSRLTRNGTSTGGWHVKIS